MIFFTADPHFGHANIIKYCNRPFASAEEMDRVLISNWNNKVGPADDVYILGDFSLKGPAGAAACLNALNGRKHLILGNHDDFALKESFDRALFIEIKEQLMLETEGLKIWCFHYPTLFWPECNAGSIHLYGHIHNNAHDTRVAGRLLNALNVGVEVCDYAPLSLPEVMERLRAHNAALKNGGSPLWA